MLENITNKITGIFQGLSNKGAITEKDLETTLREVRVALLEADVSLKVSKDLIKNIQEKALGQKVIENVQPGQQIIKIVSDELTEILGSQSRVPVKLPQLRSWHIIVKILSIKQSLWYQLT